MSKQLIACGNYWYGGARRSIGDEFTASDRDARLLIAVGQANEKVEATAKVSKTKPPKKPKKTDNGATFGRYQRSDLRAED